MKNTFSFFLVFLFLMACSPKTVLQTDTGEPIDLSGKWSKTDAEIASDQFFDALIESVWLKEFNASNNYKPTILVESFNNDFNDELANQQLLKLFEEYISASRYFDLIKEDDTSVPYFILKGELSSEPFTIDKERGINYRLEITLFNTEAEEVYSEEVFITKYLKE